MDERLQTSTALSEWVEMSVCLLHVYDVAKTDNENTNLAVLRLNTVGRYTALGGVFHGGIEVNGKEWSYGCCEKGTGVYFCLPKDNPMYSYRETVTLGATTLSTTEVDRIVAQLKEKWEGKSYDLLAKNCNHFCQEFAEKLGVSSVPGWVNRMAVSADAVAAFGAQTAEQVRWLGATTSSWLSAWTAPPQAAEGAETCAATSPGESGKPTV